VQGAWLYSDRRTKKLAELLGEHFEEGGGGGKRGDRIVIRFRTEVEVIDILPDFGDYRFSCFGDNGVKFHTFPLICVVV